MADESDIRLERLAGGSRKGRGDACPPAAEWASLAAGLLEPGRQGELLAHACDCDSCGALLHAVVEDFTGEASGEERQSLEALDSSKLGWRYKMARQMAAASSQGRLIPMRITPWLARAAAVLVAVGAGWLGWNRWVTDDPARLMAKAYTQQRPFEFRIAGAENAPVRVERGAADSRFKRPQALIEAEAKIARKLENDPANVRWLQLRARAELLARDPDAAIATLERAQAQKPGDPDLWADLGVAYALSAETQNRAADYARAAQILVRSLEAKPDNAVAVFNLALVYQRMNLYADSERQWRRYLELDAAGAWRLEAQTRLAEVQRKMNADRQP
jgi:tetratricopeptide (TPR) repeat protein